MLRRAVLVIKAEVAKAQGAKGLCTMCALKKGVSGR